MHMKRSEKRIQFFMLATFVVLLLAGCDQSDPVTIQDVNRIEERGLNAIHKVIFESKLPPESSTNYTQVKHPGNLIPE